MAATAIEMFGRQFDGTRAEFVYYLRSATDEDDARTTLLSAASATEEAGGTTLYLDEPGCNVYENNGVWYGTLSYVTQEQATGSGSAESSFEFDTTGGTQHLMASLATRDAYGSNGVGAAARTDNGGDTDKGGLIGVTRDGIEGVDIGVGQLGFTITKAFDIADVDSSFIDSLKSLTFTTNNATFAGTTDDGIDFSYDTDECLFMGARGGVRNGKVVISMLFGAADNQTGLKVGSITAIAKKAWDYMWVKYKDGVVGASFTKTPLAVYVEKVYNQGDFSLLEII